MKSQKDCKTVLVEYVTFLSDEELRYLGARLLERYSDDLATALNFMSTKASIDHILGATNTADELYQLCDVVGELIQKEARKRSLNLLSVPVNEMPRRNIKK